MGFGILYTLCLPLAILFTLIVPLTAYISSQFAKSFFSSSAKENNASIIITRTVEETMRNFKEVFSFSNQKLEKTKFIKSLAITSDAALKVGKAKALFESSNRAGIYTNILTMFAVGGLMVKRNIVKAPTLVSFIGYCWSLNFATQGLLFSYGDWKIISTPWKKTVDALTSMRINQNIQLIEKEKGSYFIGTEVVNNWSKSKAPMSIELRNVSFSYPNRPDVAILKDIDLFIPPGKITALVGPSGAGKSTIASLLNQYYIASDGNTIVDGIDLSLLPRDEYLSRVSVVRQASSLFTDTISNNIAYGTIAYRPVTQAEIVSAAKAANAHDFIMNLPEGYETLIGDREGCVQLSGGQKQRITIARAIIKNASLLVLDESTSALDSESEALVQDSLNRLMKGRTTVVIAHRLSTVINADQICVVKEGKIAEIGTHENLMQKKGFYYSLMSTQVSAYTPEPLGLTPSTPL
jgi:ABC-type multidrug transport system fused ATPase/permease subunit